MVKRVEAPAVQMTAALLWLLAAQACEAGPGAGRSGGAGGLFVVGDSYADTGNHDPLNATLNTPWRPPYGSSWPGRPSGRFSDGRLLTDYYASHIGLHNPLPYRMINDRKTKGHLRWGINFAFGGSGIFPTFGQEYPTINAQITKLKGLVEDGLYSDNFLSSSFVLLVVAGNDYTIFKLQHPYGEGTLKFINLVVDGIYTSILSLYALGFRNFAVTTLAPFGCYPDVTKSTNYSTCDVDQNLLSSYHNILLKKSILNLRNSTKSHFAVLDLESAFNRVLEGKRIQWRPCCEGLGTANCGDHDSHGNPLYTLCSSPDNYFFWDRVHPSNIGWDFISNSLFSS